MIGLHSIFECATEGAGDKKKSHFHQYSRVDGESKNCSVGCKMFPRSTRFRSELMNCIMQSTPVYNTSAFAIFLQGSA